MIRGRSTQDVAWVAREWESLRGMRSRGEVGEDAYLRRCEELSDSLGTSGEDGGTGDAGDAGREGLAFRIDLLRCLEGESASSGPDGVALELLPELWRKHRAHPARFPANPDAGSDADTGELPDVFALLWQEVVLSAALRPDVDRRTLEDLGAQASEALIELGNTEAEVAGVQARVLLALGELDAAADLLDRLPEPALPSPPEEMTWADAHAYQRDLDVRAMLALQRGDLQTVADTVTRMENAPEAHVQPTVMLAESLIPLSGLSGTVPPEVTAARAAFVADRAVGTPELSESMLQVAEYLAVSGHPARALGLLDRLLPVMALHRQDPETDVHLLAGLHTVFRAATDAGWGRTRPVFAGLPAVSAWLGEAGDGTVAGLARWTGARARAAAEALDARNGNDVETRVGLALHRPATDAAAPAPLPEAASLAAALPLASAGGVLPSWVDATWLELPRDVAEWAGQDDQSGHDGRGHAPEIPVVGPVDLASLDAGDAVAALMLYSMLGLSEATSAAVDRIAELADTGRAGEFRLLIAELLRRYDSVDSDEEADPVPDSDPDPVLDELDELLRERQRVQDDAESIGAEPAAILAARVGSVVTFWPEASPLVRRVIEQDILMGGVYPDAEALRLALRAFRRVTRLAPRSVPEVGTALLAGVLELNGDGAGATAGETAGLVAQLAHYVAGVALSLPDTPDAADGPVAMLGDEEAPELLDELISLAVALSGHGAFHESLAVYDRCLRMTTESFRESRGEVGGDTGDAGDAAMMRVHLMAARAEALAKLGNHRAAAGAFAEASDSAGFRGEWEAAAEYQVTCVSSLLDDRDFPRAAFALDTLDDIEGLDWMRFPHASFRREVEATRLATALVGDGFTEDWPGQVDRLKDSWASFRAAVAGIGGSGGFDGPSVEELGLRAAGDLVENVLRINRGLVHTDRVGEALELTAWAAGEAKTSEDALAAAGETPVQGVRLEALTEEALLLHVIGRNDEALMIFESVAQQARRAGVDWLVDAVAHRLDAAARYDGDPEIRRRYTALLGELTGP